MPEEIKTEVKKKKKKYPWVNAAENWKAHMDKVVARRRKADKVAKKAIRRNRK